VELQLLQVNDKLPEKVFELLLGTQVNFFAKKLILSSTKYSLVKLRICNPF
jgi:hypothetical protein